MSLPGRNSLARLQNIKKEPGITIKTEPGTLDLERLSSFKRPRDLSLGGTPHKTKKIFTPNLNIVRNKSKHFRMKEVRFLPNNILEEFIECYKQHACLWQIKSKDYNNRLKKTKAYEELIEICKKFYNEADRDFVVKKINSMRTCFRKELRKVENSLRSAVSEDDVYRPNLWYFDLLLFTKEQEIVEENVSNIEENYSVINWNESDFETSQDALSEVEESINSKNITNPLRDVPDSSFITARDVPDNSLMLAPLLSPSPTNPSNNDDNSYLYEANNKIRKKKEDDVIARAYQSISEPHDLYDAIGYNVACKLRKMNEEQRIIAEHRIHNILYQGMRNKLKDDDD